MSLAAEIELYKDPKVGHTPSSLWRMDSAPYGTASQAEVEGFQNEFISKYKTLEQNLKGGSKETAAKDAQLDILFFDEVQVSGIAAMKILKHAKMGIEQGRRNSDFPAEVMGCLIGHCPNIAGDKKGKLVFIDSVPLPCKGGAHSAETDPATTAALTEANELVELSDPDMRVVGWYHSHPFDPSYGKHHCFFSNTDVSTQTMYQRFMEQRSGTPFVGLVVDPYTSMRDKRFYFGAYRAFPVNVMHPICNRCPDGKIQPDVQKAKQRWRAAWNRYYELRIQFFATKQVEDIFKNLQWYEGVAHVSRTASTKAAKAILATKASLNEAAANIGQPMKSSSRRIGGGRRKGGRASGGPERAPASSSLELALDEAVLHSSKLSAPRSLASIKQVAKGALFATAVEMKH